MNELIDLPEMPTMDVTARDLVRELIEQQHSFERMPGEFTNDDYYKAQQAALGDKTKGRETCRQYLRNLVANGKLALRVARHVSYYRRVKDK